MLAHLSVCVWVFTCVEAFVKMYQEAKLEHFERGYGLRERKGGTKDKKWEDGGRRKIKKREWDIKEKVAFIIQNEHVVLNNILCIFCRLTLLSHQCSVL